MVEEKKRGPKAFAIVALIVGIVSIIFSFIPYLNIVSYFLAVVGIVFGIIGIVKKSILPMAIVGLVLSAVSIISATGINYGTTSAINEVFGGSTKTKSSGILGSKKNKVYTFGDTLTFDGLEITFDKNYKFDTLVNQFSEKNGSSVIKLGVTVKNISDESNSLNMFYYDTYGSNGTQLDRVTTYFSSESIDFAGSLLPGASYRTNFVILYDGDGKYTIEFDNFSEKAKAEFNIVK